MGGIPELVNQGKDYLENGQYPEALECFEQAIILNQNDSELWNFKAVSLRSMGRYEEAVECFNKSLEIDPLTKMLLRLNKS
jgi:tetratricopeptide (TPR) repeat protein